MQQSKAIPMPTVREIRDQIRCQYEQNPRVRLSVQIPHTKVVQDTEVVITGVYAHVFCVEEKMAGTVQRHAFQYTDVLTRRVEITASVQ